MIMFEFKKYILIILSSLCALCGVVKASPPYITIPPTPTITPLATTTFGQAFANLTQSNFSIVVFPSEVMSVYSYTTMGQLMIPYFLIFLFIYIGMWFSNANLRLASITGLLFSGLFLSSSLFGVSMPAVVIPICYGALIASIAGIVLSMFKNIG